MIGGLKWAAKGIKNKTNRFSEGIDNRKQPTLQKRHYNIETWAKNNLLRRNKISRCYNKAFNYYKIENTKEYGIFLNNNSNSCVRKDTDDLNNENSTECHDVNPKYPIPLGPNNP